MLKKYYFSKKNDIWLYKMGTVFFLVKFIIFIFEDMANYKILKKTTIIKIELRNMCINLKRFIIYFK